MGKGDKKSKKGKRFRHSYGKTRLRKKNNFVIVKKKIDEKPKPTEQKKITKPEVEQEQPAVIIPVTEEVKIPSPIVTEIKDEAQIPEIKETPVSEIPELVKEEVNIETKPETKEKDSAKTESENEKEKPTKEAPKKRGRPKKKKE